MLFQGIMIKGRDKKMFEKLVISFMDGKPRTFDKDEWDDYCYDGDFVIVKKNGAWVAMYAAKNILSVELF